MPNVIAMILTYNRKDILQQCLDAVCSQTRACDRIIVVDNASTDGTFDMLAHEARDRVTIYSLNLNVGAAGGYNCGLRLAYKMRADYIWAMDDDVIPDANALERLLSANDILAERGLSAPFVVSTARSPSGLLTNVPDLDKRYNSISYENWAEFLDNRMVAVTRATFVSILLPRATLKQYGLPHASMFIWGEDSEFTLRVTRKAPGYFIGDSRVIHVRQLAGRLDIRTEQNPKRIPYYFYLTRNDIYLKRHYEGPRAVVRHVVKQAKLIIYLCLRNERSKALIVLRGTLRGLIFNPQVEAADAPVEQSYSRTFTPADCHPVVNVKNASAPSLLQDG